MRLVRTIYLQSVDAEGFQRGRAADRRHCDLLAGGAGGKQRIREEREHGGRVRDGHGTPPLVAQFVARVDERPDGDGLLPEDQLTGTELRGRLRPARKSAPCACGEEGECHRRQNEHARRQPRDRVDERSLPFLRLRAREERRQQPRKRRHIREEGERTQRVGTPPLRPQRAPRQNERHAEFEDQVDGHGDRIEQAEHGIADAERRPEQRRERDAPQLCLTAHRPDRTVQKRRIRAEIIKDEKIEIDRHRTPPAPRAEPFAATVLAVSFAPLPPLR
mgnify:FL=1